MKRAAFLILFMVVATVFPLFAQDTASIEPSSVDSLVPELVRDTSSLLPQDDFSFAEAGKKGKPRKDEPKEPKPPLDPESLHARRAAIMGIIPGGGQIYNKRWWKLPIVYGLMGGVSYLIADNAISMRDFNKALDIRFSGGIDPYFGFLSDQQLIANRNYYRRNLQLSAVGLTALWGLSIMDAVVDAHLRTYDISDNLSFKIRPKVSTVCNKSVPSLHLSFHL